MELMEGLLSRRSIRKYQDKKIPKDVLKKIIQAGECAPSADNTQPWHFIIVEDKEKLKHFRVMQRSALFAENAAAVVLVCVDESESFRRDKEGWSYEDIDGAAATMNILLAAHALGLGGCWCGASPMTGPIAAIKEYFGLPENIRPFSIVVLGYPDETPKPMPRHGEERIHWEHW